MTPTVQTCSVCQQPFPDDEMVQLDGQWVCAACKPQFVQRMTEGGLTSSQDRERLLTIAREQRRLLITFLCAIGVMIATFVIASSVMQVSPDDPNALAPLEIAQLIQFPLSIILMIFIFRLGRVLYSTGVAVVLVLLMLFPCINLITLLVLSNNAQKELKKHGIKVGLLGAKEANVQAQLNTP